MTTQKARACAAASTTKVRPILFKSEMVRAILDGRKTQTRRIVKMPPHVLRHPEPYEILFYNTGSGQYPGGNPRFTGDQPPGLLVRCENDSTVQRIYPPKGIPGDELYVRETWRTEELESGLDGIRLRADDAFSPIENSAESGDRWVAANDNGKHGTKWRPSIFMPKWASRIQLEITNVRVERVQEITEDDAKAEGAEKFFDLYPGWGREQCMTSGELAADCEYRAGFAVLWDSINGDKKDCRWIDDPYVWTYNFRRIENGK